MVPALIGTLTLLQTLLLTALSVAREREEGTFDQLLVTPFRPVEIMAGKAIPSVVVGITQATLILLVAQLWFRIPFAGSRSVKYRSACGMFSIGVVIPNNRTNGIRMTKENSIACCIVVTTDDTMSPIPTAASTNSTSAA
jgi:ABC-type Na+ efflux pump permease subunit